MRVFITGITGTLGTALTLLHHDRGDQVWGCARSERRAVEWLGKYGKKATLFLMDAMDLSYRDSNARMLLGTVDRLYHCAAMKHVDLCEEQPQQAFRENVLLTELVTKACQIDSVSTVFVSSDKACLPQGVYGATKLLGEKIALKHGAAVVRLGNLIGSSGSVFHKWMDALKKREPIKLTHPDMTRYFMKIGDAVRFISDQHIAGKVVIPHMKSVRMGDVVGNLGKEVAIDSIGIRPGETMHQWLIAPGNKGRAVHNLKGMYYVLDDDDDIEFTAGVSSEQSERWDVKELTGSIERE